MRRLFACIALSAALTGYAQTTPLQDSMEAQIHRQMSQYPPGQSIFSVTTEKPNEIRKNGVSYNGIFVQMGKTDNPLQLVNPAAPATYGSSEDNTVWDPVTGQGRGLKLFSISF